jgi:hypothetical protein
MMKGSLTAPPFFSLATLTASVACMLPAGRWQAEVGCRTDFRGDAAAGGL